MHFQVIMPIGSNPKAIEKQKIICDISKKTDFKPRFPIYTTEDPVFNLQLALRDIKNSEFVLVDLSFERPSCYYELGLAEALGKPVYLIALIGTNIHQTASRRLVRFYDKNADYIRLVREVIIDAAQNSCDIIH